MYLLDQRMVTAAVKESLRRGFKAKNAEIEELRTAIKQANTDYHAKGKPKLSDKQYDALKDRLSEISPKDPVLQKVGAVPVGRAKKITLPTFMGSLDKVYVNQLDKLKRWLKEHAALTYILTSKLDGISALLENKNGTLFMYTRGDGSQGTDISHLIPYLKFIPKLNPGQMVRGEIVISKSDFTKYLAKDFKNPRNLAAGIANKTKVVHKAAKYGQFIIHEMIKPKAMPLPRIATQLERLGGKVVPFKIVRGAPTMTVLQNFLEAQKKLTKFEIDGVVVDDGQGNRLAIKEENEVATPTVKEVKWGLSRHGYLTPVVHFTAPVQIAGVEVTKATAHNAKMIVDGKIGPGAIVSITRAGEVIPKITGVIKGTKAQMPRAGTYEWIPPAKGKTESVFIRSTQTSDLNEVNVEKLVNFLTVLGVKGFKSNILAVLSDAGIDTPIKLIKGTASRFKTAGLGPTQATSLRALLDDALKTATMPQMMVASNCFPRGFGDKASKAAWSALGMRMFQITPAGIKAKLGAISGFGETAIASFLKGLGPFQQFLAKINWEPPKEAKKSATLAGITVVFTGFRDIDLQKKLESQGAKISSSVSKNTKYLIIRDKSYKNDKTEKADEIGVKIIDHAQALKLFK